MAKWSKNHKRYCRDVLKIEDKAGDIVPLKLNLPQKIIQKIASKQLADEGHIRLIVLKARQEGISTLVESWIFKKTSTNPNNHALIISHSTDSAQKIKKMCDLYYRELPEWLKPQTRFENKDQLTFDTKKRGQKGLNSSIDLDTAKNLDAGASFTFQAVHLSEVARFDRIRADLNVSDTLTSLFNSVPRGKGSMIVIESTAQGVGNTFHSFWNDAVEGLNDFIPVFLPWYYLPEYQMELEPGEKLELMDEYEEVELLKIVPTLSHAQLKWRRWVIRNNCRGKLDLFKQEYPTFPEEAFLYSGDTVFDAPIVKKRMDDCYEGFKCHVSLDDVGDTQYRQSRRGMWEFWATPDLSDSYVMGADVAMGLEKGDYSAAALISRKNYELVGIFHGKVRPERFAEQLLLVGKDFNNALMAIEANNHGLTTITTLRNQLGYANIYRRRTFDRLKMHVSQELGWLTTAATRPMLIDAAVNAVQEHPCDLHSKILLKECLTFVMSEKGKLEAMPGCHDDLLIAFAIAMKVVFQTRYSYEDEDLEDEDYGGYERKYGNSKYGRS